MSTQRPTLAIDASRANRPVKTGVEWYAFHVIQELKQLVPADVRVVLCTEGPLTGGLELLPPNWESRVLHWPPRYLWTQIRLAWELLVRPPHTLYLPAHLPPFIMPRRTLITLHDAAFMTMPEAYSPHGRAYLTLMYRVAVARCRMLTVSEFSKRELVRLFGASAEKITVTPLGYDTDRYKPQAPEAVAAARAKYGLAEAPYFLYVGRLETKKNLAGLLRAYRAYRTARPNDPTKLVLVGKPGRGYDTDIVELTDDLKPHVVRPGYVASEDMAALYAGATALTFVSLYEGFGIPLLEAFACGTPVICSNATSFPEVAGDAALQVEPTDAEAVARAMSRVADDAALAETLRVKGRERLKLFSWQSTAQKTWEVLREMLAQAK